MKNKSGFTLLEVMIALVVTSLALLAGSRAINSFIINSEKQREIVYAKICAVNSIVEIKLKKVFPELGVYENVCLQDGRELYVNMYITATPNKNFRRLKVVVLKKEVPIYLLNTIVGRL